VEITQEFQSRTKRLIEELTVRSSSDLQCTSGAWEELSVHFLIAPNWSADYAGQLMLLSSVNLIGRFCNNLSLPESLKKVRSKAAFAYGSGVDLLESCIDIATSINPTLKIRVVSSMPENAIALGIGAKADITITSDGWFSCLNCSQLSIPCRDNQNPFGPLIASCLGAAEIFRKLLSRLGAKGSIANRALSNIRFSALDYSCNDPLAVNPAFPESIDVGNILCCGSGAVTNGVAAALRFINGLTGSVTFLDDQNLELSNIGRYYLAKLTDVGQRKTQHLVRVFDNHSLSAHPLTMPVEAVTPLDLTRYKTVICALDNRDNNRGRIHLQNMLPERIIHAATQGLAIALANIDFLDGICLGCLFSPRQAEISTIADPSCGGVTIHVENRDEIAASVSFVSTMSGISAASELIKLSVPELNSFALRNYLSLSLMSPDLADVRFRAKDPNCVCLCSERFRQEAYKAKQHEE